MKTMYLLLSIALLLLPSFCFSQNLIPDVKDGKWGFVEYQSKKVAIPHQFDKPAYFTDFDLAKVKKNGKWGIIDKKGKIVRDFSEQDFTILTDKFLKIRWKDGIQLIDYENNEVQPHLFCSAFFNTEHIKKDAPYIFVKQLESPQLTGLLDLNGQWVLPMEFEAIETDFLRSDKKRTSNLFAVKKEGRWGYAKKGGDIIIPCEYIKVSNFDQNVAIVQKDSISLLIDTTGTTICQKAYNKIRRVSSDFQNHILAVVSKFKSPSDKTPLVGLINWECEEILPLTYQKASPFYHNSQILVAVKKEGKFGVMDLENNIVVPIVHDHHLAYFEAEGGVIKFRSGFKNLAGKSLSKHSFDHIYPLYQQFFGIRKNGKSGLLNLIRDDIVIPIQYDRIDWANKLFTKNVIVEKDNKFGLVNLAGETILDLEYDQLFYAEYLQMIIAQKEAKWMFLDINGKLILETTFEEIAPTFYPPIPVKKDGKWGFVDRSGNTVLGFKYEKAEGFFYTHKNGMQRIQNPEIYPEYLPEDFQIIAAVWIDGEKKWINQNEEFVFLPEEMIQIDGMWRNRNWKAIEAEIPRDEFGNFVYPKIKITKKPTDKNNFTYAIEGYYAGDGFYSDKQFGFFPQNGKDPVFFDMAQWKAQESSPVRWVQKNRKFGLVDNNIFPVTPIHFDRIGQQSENLIGAVKNGKVGFLNNQGEVVIPFLFDDDLSTTFPYQFQQGISVAFKNGKYGFINKEGKTVHPFEFEAWIHFDGKTAIAYKNDRWVKIDFE